MSYILDALRKADAQRERDPARGIHAQPTPAAPTRTAFAVTRGAWVAGAVLVAAGAAWFGWSQRSAATSEQPVVVAPVPEPVPAAAPVAAPVVTVATTVSPPAPPPLPTAVVVRAPERVVPKAEAPVAAAAPAAAPVTAVVPAPAPAAVPAPPAAPDRILAVAELPADVQRELPKLSISGGVHSQNAAQRLLIVGGQVVNEGAELAPGVVLEQIRARTAVLRFRGFRYSVPY
jgi:general secretion pathway protein B